MTAGTVRPARPVIGLEAVLILVTMIWGATFLVVRHVMEQGGPMGFVALRFGLAALMLGVVTGRSMRGLTRTELGAGAAIGLAIAAGYGLQTAGLQTITASTSAFITAIYVPVVPLLQWLVFRRSPSPGVWAGIALSTLGLVLLTAPGAAGLRLGPGEVMTLIAAVAIAAEVILIGRFAPFVDARRVTVVQMGCASLIALAAMPLAGEVPALPDMRVFLIAALMAVASALIQLAMNWAQRSLSPTRATLIYAGEPVWAGLFGRLAGERLPLLSLLGAALIVAAVLVAEWRPAKRR